MGLRLARALRLQPTGLAQRASIPAAGLTTAFVGAGGKTTAMFRLARELPPPVLVSTTTHLGTWQAALADQHIIAARRDNIPEPSAGVTLVTGPATSEDRFGSVSAELLLWLHDMSAQHGIPLLVEGDGSRQRPIKAPAAHEPAIPSFASLVVVVAGMSAIGKPLDSDVAHRPEAFAVLSGLALGSAVTADAISRVLLHPEGGLKNIPPSARRVALLNEADTSALQAQAHAMADALLTRYDAVLISSLRAGEVHAVHERAAGIILAAGASTRLGRPKQLLEWHGQPFVRAVAQTALTAGLDPVVLVTGAQEHAIEEALTGIPLTIVHNVEWVSGQASSIRAGLQSVPSSTGSAIFLLADQPQVTFDVLRALVDAHAASLSPIVAPLVQADRRANPVLFDRDTFPDLTALEGDVGGRAIFSEHRVEYMPWHDDRLLLDVDTEADYRRLVEEDRL